MYLEYIHHNTLTIYYSIKSLENKLQIENTLRGKNRETVLSNKF